MADLTITINPPNTNTITISDGVLPHNSTHAPSGNDSLESWYAKVSDLEYVSGQIGTPAGVVLTTGNQEIGGVKNFSSRPTVNGSGVMLTGETPGTGYLTGYVGRSETGSFVSSSNTGNFITSSQTGQFTGVFYPYSANPAAYIQGAVVRPSNTGSFVDFGSAQTISGAKTIYNAVIGLSQTTGSSITETLLGGSGNRTHGPNTTVLGGVSNSASGVRSTVVGGQSNEASGDLAMVLGGQNNFASGTNSRIFGGNGNTALNGGIVFSNSNSTSRSAGALAIGSINDVSGIDAVCIGYSNTLAGARGVAIGTRVNSSHADSLVIGNEPSDPVYSSGEYTAVIHYTGGIFLEGPTTFNSRPTFNGTGFLLSGEASAATTGYLTGYVNKTETGTFYTTNNPSGYITGVDLSAYATISSATGISGYLQTQITDNNQTGAFLTTGAADTRYINATGDVVNGNLEVSGYTSGQSFVLKNGGYLDFQTGTPAWKEGRVFYDNDSKTLAYYNDEPDITLNIGQENIVRISNGETGNIPNGKVVYISGSQGNRPKGYLASASSGVASWERTIGVSTHDISTQGYVTTFGIVNGLNTTGFVEGDHLYLSETNPGEFSTAIPSSPNHKVQVGTVLRSHATQGSILVTVNQGNHLWNLHDVKQSAWTNNQILRYNQPSGYWEAQDLNTGAFLTTGAADSRYLTSASGFNSRMSSVFTTGVISGVGGTVFSVYQSASALPMISGFAGLSGSITPINAASKIRVKLAAQVSAATNIFFGIALARSGDANAKVQTCVQTARSDITYPIFLEYEEVAGTTGRIDYITRWGPQSNNAFFTGYWNRAAAGNSFGLGSSMEIIEILP